MKVRRVSTKNVDFRAVVQEPPHEMRSDEAGRSGDEDHVAHYAKYL